MPIGKLTFPHLPIVSRELLEKKDNNIYGKGGRNTMVVVVLRLVHHQFVAMIC